MFRRLVSNPVQRHVGVRFMSGHGHGHHAELTGLRKYLPESEHLVLFVLGVYGSLFVIAKLWPSSKKAPAIVHNTASHSTLTGAVPSPDSPEFSEWLAAPGSFEKLFE